MRLLALASLAALCSCGNDTNPSRPADLTAAPPDVAVSADLAAPRDMAEAAPDLVALPDLVPAPDLTMPGGGGGMCGGFGGLVCRGGEFCDYPMECGDGDELGTCVRIPMACDKIFDPVCGCDNNQYGNDCERQVAGVSLFNHGVCGCALRCGAGKYCAQCRGAGFVCLANGQAC